MRKQKETVIKAVNGFDQPERFRLSEMGNIGLSIFNGVSSDELKRELNFPTSLKTFKEMSYHSSVNAPLTLYENIIGKLTWVHKPPIDATEEEKNQSKIINEMMTDMESSWSDFIRDMLSANVYGFSVQEKVFRRRTKAAGSKYNDGLIGWRKLPLRAQESIQSFIFSDDGNDVIGVKQFVNASNDTYGRFSATNKSNIVLPRSKVIIFRTGRHRNDPYGKSPLRDAYLAWRFLVALEDIEATGIAKDVNGMPVLYIPMEYLSSNASPEMQAIANYYQNSIRNLQAGTQTGMVLPQAYDAEAKQPMFKVELLSADGKKHYDIASVKLYYKNLIYTSLFGDILQMGQTSTGSFALGAIKNSLSGQYAERLASNIVDVLNRDLLQLTYELNGWDTSRMGTFDYDGVEPSDLETFSKAVQRMGATGFIPKTLDVVNNVLDNLGIDRLPEGTNIEDILPDSTTRSGDGMAAGTGNGTSTSVAGQNNSDLNLDNSA